MEDDTVECHMKPGDTEDGFRFDFARYTIHHVGSFTPITKKADQNIPISLNQNQKVVQNPQEDVMTDENRMFNPLLDV